MSEALLEIGLVRKENRDFPGSSVVMTLAQLVKNLPVCRRPWFDSWVGKIHWTRDRLPTPVFFLGLPLWLSW